MAKKRKKTDFTEQRKRIREIKDYAERELLRLREQREAEKRQTG